MATVQQDALTRARVKQEKQIKEREAKAERMAQVVKSERLPQTSTPASPEDQKAKGDQKSVTPMPMPKAPQAKAGDQNDVPKVKKAKKISETVRKWKDLENFGLEEKITIKATGNPKKRDATRRFALYKDGMTVGDYLKVTKENSISNALAHADVRWDHAAGLIFVTGERHKAKKA